MRINKTVCDECGKEITNSFFMLEITKIPENMYVQSAAPYTRDLCDDCGNKVKRHLAKIFFNK